MAFPTDYWGRHKQTFMVGYLGDRYRHTRLRGYYTRHHLPSHRRYIPTYPPNSKCNEANPARARACPSCLSKPRMYVSVYHALSRLMHISRCHSKPPRTSNQERAGDDCRTRNPRLARCRAYSGVAPTWGKLHRASPSRNSTIARTQ